MHGKTSSLLPSSPPHPPRIKSFPIEQPESRPQLPTSPLEAFQSETRFTGNLRAGKKRGETAPHSFGGAPRKKHPPRGDLYPLACQGKQALRIHRPPRRWLTNPMPAGHLRPASRPEAAGQPRLNGFLSSWLSRPRESESLLPRLEASRPRWRWRCHCRSPLPWSARSSRGCLGSSPCCCGGAVQNETGEGAQGERKRSTCYEVLSLNRSAVLTAAFDPARERERGREGARGREGSGAERALGFPS